MNENKKILELEHAVMERLLGSSHWIPRILLEQWKSSKIKKLEFTGAGFFVDYDVPNSAPVLEGKPNLSFGNVGAEISDLKYGAGFVLFVKNGVIATLEGYSYNEPWPNNIDVFELTDIEKKQEDWNEIAAKIYAKGVSRGDGNWG